jgi:hypothetical protein
MQSIECMYVFITQSSSKRSKNKNTPYVCIDSHDVGRKCESAGELGGAGASVWTVSRSVRGARRWREWVDGGRETQPA